MRAAVLLLQSAIAALLAGGSEGSVQGRLLIPDPAAQTQFYVRLSDKEGTEYFDIPEAGRFRWPVVFAGRYSLRVYVKGSLEPLVTIPDVIVGGRRGADPRVGSIDVRSAVRRACLLVVDERSRPIRGTDICLRTVSRGHVGAYATTTDRDGRATIWIPAGGVDVTVRSPRHRLARMHVVADRVIVLRPRIPIRIAVVSDGGTLPSDTSLLFAFHQPRGSAVVDARNPMAVCRALPGVAASAVQQAGVVNVEVSLSDPRNARGGYVFSDHPRVRVWGTQLRIANGIGPQRFVVTIPRDRLFAAIARFRRLERDWIPVGICGGRAGQ